MPIIPDRHPDQRNVRILDTGTKRILCPPIFMDPFRQLLMSDGIENYVVVRKIREDAVQAVFSVASAHS